MSHARSSPGPSLAEFHDDNDHKLLMAQIDAHLSEHLAPYALISGKAELYHALQQFSDTAMEYFCILAKTGIEGHHWLWLNVLYRLAGVSNRLVDEKNSLSLDTDMNLTSSSAYLTPLIQQVARHCEMFFEAVDVAILAREKEARGLFLKCVNESLSLSMPEQIHLKHGSLVVSTVQAISRLYADLSARYAEDDILLHVGKVEMLPTLVNIGKTAFLSGAPSAVVPLVLATENPPVSESFLPELVLDPSVTLPLITDYYRYYAFCLVTSVVEGATIDERAANKADTFFKVLLNLPHLHLSNYMADTSSELASSETKLVSSSEREEMAFFYLINYLLRMRKLADFVEPEKYFIHERRFFVASFNRRCGAELDFSVSASLSRTGSVVSMTRAAETAIGLLPHVTLSSILSEGTYKEKVRLVAEFMNLTSETGGAGSIARLVKSFDMSGLHHRTNHFTQGSHDILHIYNRIDPQQFPGKALYVKAVDMIVRLLQLVTLKHFLPVFSRSLQPAQFLTNLFGTNYLLRDVLLVKDLLYVDEEDVLQISYRASSEADRLSKQFQLLRTTRLLSNDVQKMI